jgi:hypothetical protein
VDLNLALQLKWLYAMSVRRTSADTAGNTILQNGVRGMKSTEIDLQR